MTSPSDEIRAQQRGSTLADRKAFLAKAAITLTTAVKFKSRLLKLGRRAGWTNCPSCGGRLDMRLVGPRRHARMWCETASCLQMIE